MVREPLTVVALLLWSTGSRRAGSGAMAHRPSRSVACGILPDQCTNLCPLHRQQTLNHCPTREAQYPMVDDEKEEEDKHDENDGDEDIKEHGRTRSPSAVR